MKKQIQLRVNGMDRALEVEARSSLLEVVREQLGLTGAKLACDMQVCGACTLLVNGKPVSACSVLAVDADGCDVLTIEGLGDGKKHHPLQEAFMEFGALQCGYCTSGVYSYRQGAARRVSPTDGGAQKGNHGGLPLHRYDLFFTAPRTRRRMQENSMEPADIGKTFRRG